MVSVEVLRSLPHFAGVRPESLKAVAEIAEEREFKAGETLCREGEPARWLSVLKEGEVDVVYRSQAHGGSIVDTIVPGELLGWSAIMEPHTISATVQARGNGRYLAIQADGLRKLCEKDHTLGYRLMTWVAREIRSRLVGISVQLATSG